MRRHWCDNADINDVEVLKQIAGECALDPALLQKTALAQASDLALEQAADNADAAGIFSTPCIDTGERRYFGYDRLSMLNRHAIEKASSRKAAG